MMFALKLVERKRKVAAMFKRQNKPNWTSQCIQDFLYSQIVHEQLWLKRLDKGRHLRHRLLNQYKTFDSRRRFTITQCLKIVK